MERVTHSARRPLPALTGLRFFAALHVMLLHYVWDTAARPGALRGGAIARGVLSSGYLGVSLFFVLSGFILAYNYLDASGEREVDRRRFWNARVARVYPAYLVSLAVALPTAWRWALEKIAAEAPITAVPKVIAVATLNPSLLQAWVPHTVPPWNAPGWSLSVEAFFYALFPLVGARFAARAVRRPATTAIALWAAALTGPAIYCLAAAHPYLTPVGASQPTMALTAVSYFPPLHLPEFLLGVATGKLFLMRQADPPSIGPRRWGLIADATALSYPAFLALTPALPYPLLHNGLFAPLYALLIFALAGGDGVVSRVLSRTSVVLLGEASYALYLLHLPLLARTRDLGAMLNAHWSSKWQPVTIAAASSLVLSIFVLKLIELPARRSLRRQLDGRLARAGARAPSSAQSAAE